MGAAAESGTGALTGAAFGPYITGEQTLALDLLPSFGPGMVILAVNPALDLACAYPQRWGCETVIGHHKPTWARASGAAQQGA